jgi:hypothetical protein
MENKVYDKDKHCGATTRAGTPCRRPKNMKLYGWIL